MSHEKIFQMAFSKVYPSYVTKAVRKNRTAEEVDTILCWMTGYSLEQLHQQIEKNVSFQTFFEEAPSLHPNLSLVTGVVCGVRVEEVEHPLMKQIRQLDKLVDELAKGKSMEKILRQS
ncbi:MAG: DUF2200 domain-containing protein [Candidatus Izemoplasmatales bacterium]|nr:DUF2200 domain-containing protein [Candidatus Izemoplasmatales bacterium]